MAMDKNWLKYRCNEHFTSILRNLDRRFPTLYFLLRVCKHLKNREFIDRVNKLNKPDAHIMEWHSYGNLHRHEPIMLIMIDASYGMGALYRRVARGIYLAKELNMLPVVEFTGNNAYKEDGEFLGTQNTYDYYFRQPAGITLIEAYQSYRVFICNSAHTTMAGRELGDASQALGESYEIEEDYISNMGEIVRQYIKLNERTEEYISSTRGKIIDDSSMCVLGVHIRGTDFALNWDNHPNQVLPDDYFAVIDEALANGFTHIFLATDDSGHLEIFRRKYGKKLLYYDDVHREDGVTNVAAVVVDRKNGHYLNGLEVIRDMYTLGQCDGMVCGLSQVSISARIIRYALAGPYKYLKIIDKGIYKK